MLNGDRLIQLRKAYVRYVIAFIEGNDPNDNLLRTFLDNWFAYYKGGPFLNSSGKARWFNTGDLAKKPVAARAFHFHSKQAWDVYEGRLPREPLVKDHILPLAVIRDGLKQLRPRTEEVIEQYLIDHYKVALITKEEHDCLSKEGLKSRLPEDANGEVIKRYAAVGIELIKQRD